MPVSTPSEVLNRHFPHLVVAAQVNLAVDEKLWTLPGPVLRLAQIFAAHTPVNAVDLPIVCSRRKAAELLGVHERSVTRYVNCLEKHGVVQRLKQSYQGNGSWECLKVVWTAYGCKLFADIRRSYQLINAVPLENSSPAASAILLPNVSEENETTSFELTTIQQSTTINEVQCLSRETNLAHRTTAFKSNKLFTRSNPASGDVIKNQSDLKHGRLPANIVEAASQLELKGNQVSLLFRVCKNNGKWLQDILAVTLEGMLKKSLKGREAVGYIIALAKQDRDFLKLAQHKQQEEEQEIALGIEKARVEAVANSLECGQILPSGRVVDQIAGGIAFFIDPVSGERDGSQPIDELAKDLEKYAQNLNELKIQVSLRPLTHTVCAEKKMDSCFAEQSLDAKNIPLAKKSLSECMEILNNKATEEQGY